MVHLFLLPLIMTLAWWYIYTQFRLSLKQGLLGLIWIVGLSTFVALFLTLMIQITH